MFEPVRSDDHVEAPRYCPNFRPDVFMPLVSDSGLLDGCSRKIQTGDRASRESPRQRRYTLSERASPVEDCYLVAREIGRFVFRQIGERSLHEVACLLASAVRVPLPLKVVVPPRARVDLSGAHGLLAHGR